MVSIYLKWHCHEVRPELGYRPHDSQALQFSGGVGFFSLVEGSGRATDDAFLAIADLSQDRIEASGGGVGIEAESLAKIRKGSDEAGCQQVLQPVEGVLAFGAPVKDRVFPG